jgi:hypothetical protein
VQSGKRDGSRLVPGTAIIRIVSPPTLRLGMKSMPTPRPAARPGGPICRPRGQQRFYSSLAYDRKFIAMSLIPIFYRLWKLADSRLESAAAVRRKLNEIRLGR